MSFSKTFGSRGLAAALAYCLLSGCGSKLTSENVAKVKDGMTRAEVEAILGTGRMGTSPDESGISMGPVGSKTETWKDGQMKFVVFYADDKVCGIEALGGQ